MQGNVITTIIALLFYLTSGLFGVNSGSSSKNSALPPEASIFYPRSGVIASDVATIRSESSTSSSTVGSATKGSRLIILGEKNGLYQVQTNSGITGWVAKWMVTAQAPAAGTVSKGRTIAGYYVENYYNDPVGYSALSANLGTINTVMPFSFNIDQYGTIHSTHNPKPVRLARSAGAVTLAVVNNIKGDNFNSSVASKLLSSPTYRSKAVSGISRMLQQNGFQGVNIDFENVPARSRNDLTAFFRELAAELRPKGLLVTASLPAKTSNDRSSSHGGAYDYQAIAPYLDQAMIMTYDEHYAGGAPGPVASYPWVDKVIRYTLNYFQPSKVVLGLAAYGYNWSMSSGKAQNYKAIQNLIKQYSVAPKWHPTYKVPYFTYKSWGIKHQVWYENASSTAAKMQLVRNYGLKGVAVWRLGYEDPAIWNVIRQSLY
jgi:spore germination protein YaaH